MRPALFAAVSLAFLAGCVSSLQPSPPGPMQPLVDEEATKREVLQYVHVGMGIDEAQAIMEARGFECTRCDAKGNHLFCDLPQKCGDKVTRNIRVTIDYDGKTGKTTHIATSTNFTFADEQ
jgi:hypothetical protein